MRITRSKSLRLLDLPAEIFEHHIIPALDYPHRYALSAVNRFFRGLLRGRLFLGRGKEYDTPTTITYDEKVFYSNGHWHAFGSSNDKYSRTLALLLWNLSQSYPRLFPCPKPPPHIVGISLTGKYIWMYNIDTQSLSIHDARQNGRIVYTVDDAKVTPELWFNNDEHFILPHQRSATDDVSLMVHTVAPLSKTASSVPPHLCATFPASFEWFKVISRTMQSPWNRHAPMKLYAVVIIPDLNPRGFSIQCVADNHPLVDTLWAVTYDFRFFVITKRDTAGLFVYDVDNKTVVSQCECASDRIEFVAASPVAYEFAVRIDDCVVLMQLEGTTLTEYCTLDEVTFFDDFQWHPTIAGLYAIHPIRCTEIIIGYRCTRLGSVEDTGSHFEWAPDGSSLAVYGSDTITIYE